MNTITEWGVQTDRGTVLVLPAVAHVNQMTEEAYAASLAEARGGTVVHRVRTVYATDWDPDPPLPLGHQIEVDLLLYGNAYIEQNLRTGERRRIDPRTITVQTNRTRREADWTEACKTVLGEVFAERKRQVLRYGFNDECLDGTGPDVEWLRNTDVNLDLRTATEIEKAFRSEYEKFEKENGKPTWMHLIREEVAESFAESDPGPLIAELTQVAALCVSWIEAIRRRG